MCVCEGTSNPFYSFEITLKSLVLNIKCTDVIEKSKIQLPLHSLAQGSTQKIITTEKSFTEEIHNV